MNIHLSANDLQAAELLVATGQYNTVEEVISAGIQRLTSSEELRQKVQVGIDQANRGEVIGHDVLFDELMLMAKSLDNTDD